MPRKIKSAAVIGSGVMGGGIAALLAGTGIKTLLLDIVPLDLKAAEKNDPLARNRIVKAGLDAALMNQPALFMSPNDAELITIGNLEDDFDKMADCDWIIEVVVENLKIKQDLLKRIEAVRKQDTIVSTNRSEGGMARSGCGAERLEAADGGCMCMLRVKSCQITIALDISL